MLRDTTTPIAAPMLRDTTTLPSSRLLQQLSASCVSVLLLALCSAVVDAAAAVAASVCNLASSAKSLLLMTRHVHWTTASQLAALWHGAMRAAAAARTSGATASTASNAACPAGPHTPGSANGSAVAWWWLSRWLLHPAAALLPAGPGPAASPAAAAAVVPSGSGRLAIQPERHLGLYPRRPHHHHHRNHDQQQQQAAVAAALQARGQRLPCQLPAHAGRLTVALDLDETLLATFRLAPGAGPDSLQLVPSCWPATATSGSSSSSSSSGGSSRRRSSARPAGTTSAGSSGGGYSVSTARPCDAELAALLAAHGGATLLQYAPSGGSGGGATTLVVFERPGVREFLERLSGFAELVLFTAGAAAYAQPLADLLDPSGQLFRWRLFGDATVAVSGRSGVKDLSCFGRDLSRVVLVDNNLHSFLAQPANGLPCPPYHGGAADGHLLGVILPLLGSLSQLDDIRPLLAAKFRVAEWLASKGYEPPGAAAGREQQRRVSA